MQNQLFKVFFFNHDIMLFLFNMAEYKPITRAVCIDSIQYQKNKIGIHLWKGQMFIGKEYF